jgi:hypothetical protein
MTAGRIKFVAEAKNRELTVVFTVAIVLAFAAFDYLTPLVSANGPPINAEWLIAIPFGAFMAEAMLIAVWEALGTLNIVIRSALWLLFGLMMWYLLIFAIQNSTVEGSQLDRERMIEFGVFIISGVTILQVPLWMARLVFRVRMLSPDEDAASSARARLQFQLKDLLLATTIVAIALSPLRLIMSKESHARVIPGSRPFIEMAVVLVVAAAIVLAGTLPGLWAAFSRRRTFELAVALAVYVPLVTAIELAIAIAIVGRPPGANEGFEVFGVLCLLNLVQIAVFFSIIRTYYALGYRLQRVPRRAHVESDSPS